LLIDNCASGGRRIDLEMCMRSVPMWRSDTGCASNPVHWNQVQCCGLSQYVPLHAVANWTPAAYDVRSVASAGVVCQWDYLAEKFPVDLAKAAVAEARENQKFWIGDFYPLLPATLADEQWAAYQFHRADLDAGIVLVFRRGESNYTGLTLALSGLKAEATYAVEFSDEARAKTTQQMTGKQLASGEDLRIDLPRRGTSVLVRYGPVGTAASGSAGR
jgi:alpha-galactosidase